MKRRIVQIKIDKYRITVSLDGKGGTIRSNLHETPTPIKVDRSLDFRPGIPPTTVDDFDEHSEFNAAMDGIESLILAHACAGIKVDSAPYIEGIRTAVNACGNNL